MVFTEVASTYKDTTAGDVILNDNYSKIYEGKKNNPDKTEGFNCLCYMHITYNSGNILFVSKELSTT